jgi:hypothetical protein
MFLVKELDPFFDSELYSVLYYDFWSSTVLLLSTFLITGLPLDDYFYAVVDSARDYFIFIAEFSFGLSTELAATCTASTFLPEIYRLCASYFFGSSFFTYSFLSSLEVFIPPWELIKEGGMYVYFLADIGIYVPLLADVEIYAPLLADIGIYVALTSFTYFITATYLTGDLTYFGPSFTELTGFTCVYPIFLESIFRLSIPSMFEYLLRFELCVLLWKLSSLLYFFLGAC